MTVEQYQKELLKLLESATENFSKALPEVEQQALRRVELLVKDLEIKNGNILNTVSNLRVIGRIKAELEGAIMTPKYIKAVQEFVNVFDAIAEVQKAYFMANFQKKPPKELLDQIQKQAKDAVVDKLLGRGFDAEIVMKVEDILRTNITTGGSYSKLAEQLRQFMLTTSGAGGIPSRIAAYAKTLTVDSINQFSAQYHDQIQSKLNLKWYMYVGSNLTTTRQFCELLTKKKYVHISELPAIIDGQIDGKQVKMNPKTKLWYGAIEGTNEANFRIYRGGHNCGHQFIAVNALLVPKEIRDLYK
jgi:hypothetical protein